MRKDSLMRMGQQADEAPEDYFHRYFFENAEKRVKLDLLFSEFVKFFKLEVNQERVDEFVERKQKNIKIQINLRHGSNLNPNSSIIIK